jgi:hypothetical protein
MKKRPFILLEVLIALLLVILCVAPLAKIPLTHYRSELKALEKLEKSRAADWAFTEVLEQILKNEIPWKDFPEKGKTSPRRSLPPAVISLPGQAPKQVPLALSFRCTAEKEGLNGEIYKNLEVRIHILNDQTKYSFRLIVKKI